MGRKRDAARFAPEYAAWLAAVRGRVRDLRAARGLTLRAAADLIGMEFANLSRIETGATAEPTIGILWDIAAGYGVPVSAILCDAPAPKKRRGK